MNQYDGFEFVEVKYTASDRSEAVVVAVNCPEPGFKCKEIVEVMPEEAEADA